MNAHTNNTRHEIIHILESIHGIVNQHDEAVDRSRSTALEEMERQIGAFRGEGERLVDVMQDLMVDLRDNSLETVARAGRSERREPREEREINHVEREFINSRGRWEPQE
eukprot:6764750-Karenia_brevis.AAC.1